MSNLEPLRKIIEEIKNMTPEQEEQFKKDMEKFAEKYKLEDYNYDDIEIIFWSRVLAILKQNIAKEKLEDESEEVNWLTPEKKQALKSLKGSVKLPIDYFDLKYWDEDESDNDIR